MFRRSRRDDAARQQVEPAAADRVYTDRVGPLAQSAAEKVGPLAQAAADAIGAAADKVSPLAHAAADRVGPLAQSAADRVGPLAQTAADRITPLAGSARERVSPYARLAADRVSPYTQTAAGYASSAAERFAPAVAAARGRVTEDLLPKLSGVWGVAAANARAEEAARQAEAARAELVVPKKKGRWVKRVAVIGAVGAVVAVVVRRFFGSKDADWQAARPSAPYVPPPTSSTSSTSSGPTVSTEATAPPVSDRPAESSAGITEPVAAEEDFAATEPAPVTMLNVTDGGDVEETVVDTVVISEPVADLPEGEPETEPPLDELAGPAPRWSGEGVYVGPEPPEGFVIKGNERSMKYHMPEAAGYSRTSGDVWFNSEEAAQEAGFVRAQR